MVDKREMEQAQLFETADERGCTPMFGAAHRRASAVPYPRRYEVCSLGIADCGFTSSPVSKVRNPKLAIGNLKSW